MAAAVPAESFLVLLAANTASLDPAECGEAVVTVGSGLLAPALVLTAAFIVTPLVLIFTRHVLCRLAHHADRGAVEVRIRL